MELQPNAPAWLKQMIVDQFGWAWGGVAIAWCLLISTGHHHASAPSHIAFSFFHSLASWEIMIVAMMLPSVLPVAQLFEQVSQKQPDHLQAKAAFLAGYLAIWTGFAVLSVSAEVTLKAMPFPPLSSRIIFSAISIGVGIFQFTPFKQKCLQGCRSAATFIAQHYDRGWQGGLNLGIQHGLYCLGCCIALMIEMAIVGLHNLQWMLLLTAIMTLERLWKFGEQLAIWVGIGFILIGLSSFLGL